MNRTPGWGEDAPLANFPKAPERDRTAEIERAVAAGLRRLDGKHVTLLTDLPSDPEVDRLPEAFDLAFPQWCDYFGLRPEKHANWHVTGYLMLDKERFAAVGLLPPDLPPFKHGFSRGDEFWLYEQPNAYYRRHLMLHEGTHSFMFMLLGSGGPAWYSEGMAELLATHRWDETGLRLRYFPVRREDVPELGRIKLVQDSLKVRRAEQLLQVMNFTADVHQHNEGYAWCWAVAAFLDGHPRYRDRFRKLAALTNSLDFSGEVRRLFGSEFMRVCEEWQVFVANLEHAYDAGRMTIDFTPGAAPPPEGAIATVAADQGWQNTGWRLESGATYQLSAQGRYQLATEPVIWWSEPGGVSIRYYHGQPLGKLLAVVLPEAEPADGRSAFLEPIPIGLTGDVASESGGTLYLRINDSAGELADNQGVAEVEINRRPAGD